MAHRFLLTVFVIISQVIIYAWVQRSVSGHFEQMDSEILTHAALTCAEASIMLMLRQSQQQLQNLSH